MITPFKEPILVTRPILPDLRELGRKLTEIWDLRWLTNIGPQHRSLEEKLSATLKVPHCSLFNNGTIALLVACRALKLTGDVITTPFTFPATPHALTWNGLTPVFCDIDPLTMNIDPRQIELSLTPRITAIMAVHVFGTPCDVDAIQRIAERHGLRIIYDAAHAFGVERDGAGIGTAGDISMFSFHATKIFHTAEGGALTYTRGELTAKISLMKNFGIQNEENVLLLGINGKMSELHAALGLLVLERVEEEIAKRKRLVEAYRQLLNGVEGISSPPEPTGVTPNHQFFAIRIDEALFGRSRDYVYEKFKGYNVFTRKYFHPLCCDYPCYRDLPSSAAPRLPVARKIAREVLSLPLYGELMPDDVERICAILRSFR